jgi:nucleotide-binding universal stress UspA family protein/tellurite resistance protein
MADTSTLSAQDWHELELAPIWILSAVGAADGKIDSSERAALHDGISRCTSHSDPFVRGVFERVSLNFDTIWQTYTADERFAVNALRTVAEVLGRTAEPAQALHFKQTLVTLGIEVADASGGVLGVGGKRSKAERAALNDVAKALGMPGRRMIAASQSTFDSLLVPLDGSPEAEAALSVARTIATSYGSHVTLLEVVADPRPPVAVAAEGFVVPTPVVSTEELKAEASAYLQSVRSTYGDADWQLLVGRGAPADVIVAHARDCGADLVVMATSGSAGLKRLFESKVTENVVRMSEIPVLLVPLGEDGF